MPRSPPPFNKSLRHKIPSNVSSVTFALYTVCSSLDNKNPTPSEPLMAPFDKFNRLLPNLYIHQLPKYHCFANRFHKVHICQHHGSEWYLDVNFLIHCHVVFRQSHWHSIQLSSNLSLVDMTPMTAQAAEQLQLLGLVALQISEGVRYVFSQGERMSFPAS